MDQEEVLYQLNDLPLTFQRPGAPFTNLIDAIAAALARGTTSDDSTTSQLTFVHARYGWLDVWGELFGVPRNPNEADSRYSSRIQYTVTAGGGPPAAIVAWCLYVWGVAITIAENIGGPISWPTFLGTDLGQYIGTESGQLLAVSLGGPAYDSVGYTLTFPANLSLGLIQQIINSLARVRPAGVPFQVAQIGAGTFLDTVNYAGGAPRVTGAYLSSGSEPVPVAIGAGTNNSPPLLPDLYLTDPTLNPA